MDIILNISKTSADTSDGTATASDIVEDKTAYVNGTKITGTMQAQGFYIGTSEPTSSVGSNNDMFFIIEA